MYLAQINQQCVQITNFEYTRMNGGEERMDGWKAGWMDGWMNGRLNEYFYMFVYANEYKEFYFKSATI